MQNVLHEITNAPVAGHQQYCTSFVKNKEIVNKIVLDIGCGYGWCELNFIKRGVKQIYGTEISESDLQPIRAGLKSQKLKIMVADATQLLFKNNYFDVVVCWEVLEHIPPGTESKMFSEISRVLKPGGLLFLSTPNDHLVSKIFDPAWWLIGHRHYSLQKLKDYGLASRLQLEDFELKGRHWELINNLNLYFSKWILRRDRIFRSFFDKKVNLEYQYPGYLGAFIKYKKIIKK